MVENGKPRGLTGAFQAVQWGAIYMAAVLVGELGGLLAERRSLHAAFVVAALFPLISFGMTLFVVHDPPARASGLPPVQGRDSRGPRRARPLDRRRLYLLLDLRSARARRVSSPTCSTGTRGRPSPSTSSSAAWE